MKILGINVGPSDPSAQYRDGGASLIVDGKLSGAIAEERLTRQKHCGGFRNAAEALLGRAGLCESDLDLVVACNYGDEPNIDLYQDFGFPDNVPIAMIPSHHLAHAYTAFLPSPFDEALVLVADNEGAILGPRVHKDMWRNAMERLTVYHGKGHEIRLLERDMETEDAASLGELYGNMTRLLGLGNYLNAGKTMALAAYGDPSVFRHVRMLELEAGGRVRCAMRNEYLNASDEIRRFFSEQGVDLPGPCERYEEGSDPVWANLAAAVQEQLEEALLHKVRHWVEATGINTLCLAGGVALNCVANRRLLDETPLVDIFVQPNSGDQGLSLGAALYGWHVIGGQTRRVPFDEKAAYFGQSFEEKDFLAAVQDFGGDFDFTRCEDVVGTASDRLAEGQIIGWFQGRSEWGPRALGNRSILADPRDISMKDRINASIKHREAFRPFAPVVLEHRAAEFFEIDRPSPFMTIVAKVRPEASHALGAVRHVDETARVQTVSQDQNPLLFRLISRFEEATGLPVLLNTSFNDNGEPVVEGPIDALSCFERTGLDCLFIGENLVERREA
ncbi:MAG: carbamoyltransferase C-terminal domain-containing protein [Erythrobacter sp.]|nr:carbamoyltransferase C-terminal domain-containing protein [Erythrobacter sp.]